jgi:hypothetical protein
MANCFYLTHAQASHAVRFLVQGSTVMVHHNAGAHQLDQLDLSLPEARQHWLALRSQGWNQTQLVGHPVTI